MVNMMFDEDLEHLKVKDIRQMFGHLKLFAQDDEEEEELSEDLNRYVL